MNAFRWLSVAAPNTHTPERHRPSRAKSVLRVEPCEARLLLSGTAGVTDVAGVQLPPAPSAAWAFAQPAAIGPVSAALHTEQAASDPMAPQTIVQVLSIPDSFTNFNSPLIPDLQL